MRTPKADAWPRGGAAVMADRLSAAAIEAEADPVRRLYLQLGYFPTPPWATRALLEHVVLVAAETCWEPAAGQGHMAGVLAEYFAEVWRTDVHDFGGLNAVGSFIGAGPDVVACPRPRPDWIITNPPFPEALGFAERALAEARHGVALLLRTAWLEGGSRYERLFRDRPPTTVAIFVERVPMTLGQWDADADTMTAYAWFVWDFADTDGETRLEWIPPGCRQRLERPDDRRRFASCRADGPDLFGGGA